MVTELKLTKTGMSLSVSLLLMGIVNSSPGRKNRFPEERAAAKSATSSSARGSTSASPQSRSTLQAGRRVRRERRVRRGGRGARLRPQLAHQQRAQRPVLRLQLAHAGARATQLFADALEFEKLRMNIVFFNKYDSVSTFESNFLKAS